MMGLHMVLPDIKLANVVWFCNLLGLILLILAVDSQKIKGLYYSILKVSVRSDRDPTSVRLRSLGSISSIHR